MAAGGFFGGGGGNTGITPTPEVPASDTENVTSNTSFFGGGSGSGLSPTTDVYAVSGSVSNDIIRINLNNGAHFEINASSLAGQDGPQGPQGYQGSWNIFIYASSLTNPGAPTDVTWQLEDNTQSLTGANSSDWSLDPSSFGDTDTIWLSSAFYDPAVNMDSEVSTWNAPFLLTRPSQPLPLDSEVQVNHLPSDSEASGSFVTNSEGEEQLVLNLPRAQGSIDWIDERTDDTYTATKFEVDEGSGLELVLESDTVVLKRYVAPADFAITIGGGQSNLSWFNTDTTRTAGIGASSGTLESVDSATVNNSSSDVSINHVSNIVSYPVSATQGSYTLRVSATGANADNSDTDQTATASHSWTVYRDWFLHTNQSGANATGQLSGGREQSNLSNGHTFTVAGNAAHTYIAYSNDLTVTFTTNLGPIVPTYTYNQNYTENGVTKLYRVAYLGYYTVPSDITVEVS